MSDNVKFHQYLEAAKALRTACLHAEVEFFEHLVRWKKDTNAWLGCGSGYTSFDKVLCETKLVKAHRFSEYEELKTKYPLEQIRTVGIDALVRSLSIPDNVPSNKYPDKPAREAYLDEAMNFPVVNNVPMSNQQSAVKLKEHYNPKRTPQSFVNWGDENFRLKKENEELRQQIDEKDREIARLIKKLEKAEAKLAKHREARAVE